MKNVQDAATAARLAQALSKTGLTAEDARRQPQDAELWAAVAEEMDNSR